MALEEKKKGKMSKVKSGLGSMATVLYGQTGLPTASEVRARRSADVLGHEERAAVSRKNIAMANAAIDLAPELGALELQKVQLQQSQAALAQSQQNYATTKVYRDVNKATATETVTDAKEKKYEEEIADIEDKVKAYDTTNEFMSMISTINREAADLGGDETALSVASRLKDQGFMKLNHFVTGYFGDVRKGKKKEAKGKAAFIKKQFDLDLEAMNASVDKHSMDAFLGSQVDE